MPSVADDSSRVPPSSVVAQPEFDAELAAMLTRAAANIRLE